MLQLCHFSVFSYSIFFQTDCLDHDLSLVYLHDLTVSIFEDF